MNPAVRAGLTGWPPGAPPPERQGGGEPNGDFTDLLDSFTARTALAEGRQQGPADTGPEGETTFAETQTVVAPGGDAIAEPRGEANAERAGATAVAAPTAQPTAGPVGAELSATSAVTHASGAESPLTFAANQKPSAVPGSGAEPSAPSVAAQGLAAGQGSGAEPSATPAIPSGLPAGSGTGSAAMNALSSAALPGGPEPAAAAASPVALESGVAESAPRLSHAGSSTDGVLSTSEHGQTAGRTPATPAAPPAAQGSAASADELGHAAVTSKPVAPPRTPAPAGSPAAATPGATAANPAAGSETEAVHGSDVRAPLAGRTAEPEATQAQPAPPAGGRSVTATPTGQGADAAPTQPEPTAATSATQDPATSSAAEEPASPAAQPDEPDESAPSQPRATTADRPALARQERATAEPAPPRSDVAPTADQQLPGPIDGPGARGLSAREAQHAAPLPRAVESADAMLRLVARRGITQASLSLRPAALGAIEVNLRATSDGVVATVAADSSEAAKLLQHAEGDLRRALEDSGVRLLRLDISWSRDPRAGNGERDHARHGDGRGPRAADQTTSIDNDQDPETVVQLPNGVLVDVLA